MSSHALATPHAPAKHGITISCCRQLHNWCSSLVAHGSFEPMCHKTLACSCDRCETAKVLCHRWTSPSRKVPENLCNTFGKEADHLFGWFPAHMPDASSRPSVRQQTLNTFPYGHACIGCRMWSKPVCRMPWRIAFALMFAFTLTDSSRRCSLRSCALFSKSCSEALLSCSLQPILKLRMSAQTQPAQDSAIVDNV